MRAMVAVIPILLFSCTASTAWGAGPAPDQRLTIGRLPCATDWDGRAHGWRQLAWETMKRTSVEAALETRPVDPDSADLFQTPLLLWSCEGPVAELSAKAVGRLRQFLTLGGLLFLDDPGAQPGGPFDRSVRALLGKLFPDRRLQPIRWDHVLFKAFFLIDQPAGRRRASPHLLGIELDQRLAVIFSQNDLLGAIGRDLYGNWEFVVESGGEAQREESFRLGINLLFYGLCLDYKDDRVHLPFILKRRRL